MHRAKKALSQNQTFKHFKIFGSIDLYDFTSTLRNLFFEKKVFAKTADFFFITAGPNSGNLTGDQNH